MKCHIACEATYTDSEDYTTRNVCCCEVTGRCHKCGRGPVLECDDPINETFVCRGCAKNPIEAVVRPVRRTGPDDLHDIIEVMQIDAEIDLRAYKCEMCDKVALSKKWVAKNTPAGPLLCCPGCGNWTCTVAEVNARTGKPKKSGARGRN